VQYRYGSVHATLLRVIGCLIKRERRQWEGTGVAGNPGEVFVGNGKQVVGRMENWRNAGIAGGIDSAGVE
jgi:hypothetical protein